jgi:hypothetical protein
VFGTRAASSVVFLKKRVRCALVCSSLGIRPPPLAASIQQLGFGSKAQMGEMGRDGSVGGRLCGRGRLGAVVGAFVGEGNLIANQTRITPAMANRIEIWVVDPICPLFVQGKNSGRSLARHRSALRRTRGPARCWRPRWRAARAYRGKPPRRPAGRGRRERRQGFCLDAPWFWIIRCMVG